MLERGMQPDSLPVTTWRGEFHFGYVHGHMTVEYADDVGVPKAEWS